MKIRLKTAFQVETTDRVLFIHRPHPAENAGLVAYIENEISEILSPEENISDVVYRYAINADGLLIAVARKSALKATSSSRVFYRLPAPVLVWNDFRNLSGPATGEPVLIYRERGAFSYLLRADARHLYRVHQFPVNGNLPLNIVAAVQRMFPEEPGRSRALFCFEALPAGLENSLASHNITVTLLQGERQRKAVLPVAEWLEPWDFRLPEETEAQNLFREKEKTLRVAAAVAGVMAIIGLSFFGMNRYYVHQEEAYARNWRRISPSLNEMTRLRSQNASLISEILLSSELMDKRTSRAVIFECLARTIPSEVRLSELRIGEKRKVVKAAEGPASQETVVLAGHSTPGGPVTKWMEMLQKEEIFTSVKLLSLGKEKGRYRFKVECGIR